MSASVGCGHSTAQAIGSNVPSRSSDIGSANKLDVSDPFSATYRSASIWRSASGNFICARSIPLYTTRLKESPSYKVPSEAGGEASVNVVRC